MEVFKIKNLTFSYPETEEKVLDDINISINNGEFIAVCGPSGSGKSTLLKHFKPVLTPHGMLSGEIYFNNKDIHTISNREQAQQIGFVMQSPDNQIVTDKVWHELAFGLESLGYDKQTIRKRVAETASFFGIENQFNMEVSQLSGGQKQILNLASIMAMQPSVLILDEPTSQLDPIAASEFLSCLSKINRELGVTIIIAEHRLEEVIPLCTRLLVLEEGKIVAYDTPYIAGAKLKSINNRTFNSMPASMRIWYATDDTDNCPINIPQGRQWLEKYTSTHQTYKLPITDKINNTDKEVLSLKDVWFRYEKNTPDILKGFSVKLYKGEFAAILGGNGTGKSTALSVINGLNTPYKGKLNISSEHIATLTQNPQSLFVKKTLIEDLYEIFDGTDIQKDEREKRVKDVIKICRLNKLIDRHPYDLSGGEMERAGLAKVLLLMPKILLLDEPTKGLDSDFKRDFAQIIKTLTNSGTSVLMVSHDVEFCAEFTDRCMLMFNGEIVSEDISHSFFEQNSFYATSANRMCRNILDGVVTVNDAIYCLTGKTHDENYIEFDITDYFDYTNEDTPKKQINIKEKLPLWKKILGVISALFLIVFSVINLDLFDGISSESIPLIIKIIMFTLPIALLMLCFGSVSKKSLNDIRTPKQERKLTQLTVVASAMILLAIPLTIFIGVYYLDDKKYLFISLLVLIECMLPFFMVFEGRKPHAREVVIIAVLSAVAISGRFVFSFIPQFKPVLAIVIISGVSLGAEAGFLTGAVTMLASNMMFGQGPWTPWQMFGMGIIGFLSGILFKKGLMSRNRAVLCVFGFMCAIFIYGFIMNLSSAVISGLELNYGIIASYIASGIPMDLIHAFATVVFLFFGAEPLLEKLDRVKTKYGLIQI